MTGSKKKKVSSKLSAGRDNPALVDSSYTAFFLLSVVVWAHIFTTYFPENIRTKAFVVFVAYALVYYVFRFALKQFYDGVTIMKMVILYFSLLAIMAVASAIKGPIAEGQVPVITVILIGSALIISGSWTSLLVATAFVFYGAITFIAAGLTASVLELLYDFTNRLLPRPLWSLLKKTDGRIDRASDTISWKLFAVREWPGVVATTCVLLTYVAVYAFLLIF